VRADAVSSEVRAKLNARGERMTRPRQAVLAAMTGNADHLTVEEICAAVAALDPAVHRASVYRTLDMLVDLGIVQHVHVGHGSTVYHLASSEVAHLHLQCVRCGSITDAPLALLSSASDYLERTYGFTLDSGHVALAGLCRSCTTETSSSA
jgi:Fur family ferric uptake transcriptional regulator